ncbi:MAG: hypothetical protein K0R23_3295 [Lacrimispora sp.]|nr:hypothetical protein [Lacrimispora sp.]
MDRQGLPQMHRSAVMQTIAAVASKTRLIRERNGIKMEMFPRKACFLEKWKLLESKKTLIGK